jgi:hypothetical protein
MGKRTAFGIVSSILVATGCTATPAGQDLFVAPQGTEPADPSDPSCAAVAPACNDDENAYATLSACTSAGETLCRRVGPADGSRCGTTLYCGSSQAQCRAIPTCDAGDDEVSSCSAGDRCYARTTCGQTITCRRSGVTCDAIPVCDPGDEQVWGTDTCSAPSVECYSRTMCGTTIWCVNIP